MIVAYALGAVATTVSHGVDLDQMRREVESHCSAGKCSISTGSKLDAIANTTDCKGRLLAYEYGLQLIPARAPQMESFEALELGTTCGVTPPKGSPTRPTLVLPTAAASATYYVDYAKGSDAAAGTKSTPFKTLARALVSTRKATSIGAAATMVLAPGIHFLETGTLQLDAKDSKLTISADPTMDVDAVGLPWISGGVPLYNMKWSEWKSPLNSSWNIWVADVPASVTGITGLNTLAKMPDALPGTYSRMTRAREPSGDIEKCVAEGQHGCWHSGVDRWHTDLSCVGKAETLYIDLRNCADDGTLIGHPTGTPCKNDSKMWNTYNTYSNGHGGCCSSWSGDDSPYGPMGNYFCGNSSAGGWVGFEDPRGQNHSQGLSPALPFGFDYNSSKYPMLANYDTSTIEGAVMHVWRAQGWFVNMFEVASHDAKKQSMEFTRVPTRDGSTTVKGGWQGGRGWQVDTDPPFVNSTSGPGYLHHQGKWMIENVKEALDSPNEWWYDVKARKLYVIPNVTTSSNGGKVPPSLDLVAVALDTLISINATMAKPASDITLQGVGLRDAADIVMKPWGVPSGGDWGLFRGGAVFIEGCVGCTVQHNTFERIDGNGVFVSGYTRDVSIMDNEFAWIGDSAMAGWGYTQENDGTDGQQPRFTHIARNYVREIGLIEKQVRTCTCFYIIDLYLLIDVILILLGPSTRIPLRTVFDVVPSKDLPDRSARQFDL